MSDVLAQALIAAVVTLVLAWMNYRNSREIRKAAEDASIRANEVARKAEEVKTTLASAKEETDIKLEKLARTSRDTHTLVNNNMGVQLKLHAIVTRRLADTTKEPADEEAAVSAEVMYQEHMRKQSIVDAAAAADKGNRRKEDQPKDQQREEQ